MTLSETFNIFYTKHLFPLELFQQLSTIKENSPWHREDSVLIHTNTVIHELYNRVDNNSSSDFADIASLFAAAFHDVGKYYTQSIKSIEPNGLPRLSFSAHEQSSATHWQDYAIKNWDLISSSFPVINQDKKFIWLVSWMIEFHLPYKIKKPDKLKNLYNTTSIMDVTKAFGNLLLSDAAGRISDNFDVNYSEVETWVNNYNSQSTQISSSLTSEKICYVLIGASGSGKSTYVEQLKNQQDISVFSLDQLRLDYYSSDYDTAYKMSVDDKDFFTTSSNNFLSMVKNSNNKNIVVDNMNLTRKRRNFYITAARCQKYKIVGVLFLNTLETLLERQQTRMDKHLSEEVVRLHYSVLQQPSYGEFDLIQIVG